MQRARASSFSCKMRGGEEKRFKERPLSGCGCPLIGHVGLVMSGILIEIVEPLENRCKTTTFFIVAPTWGALNWLGYAVADSLEERTDKIVEYRGDPP